MSFKKYFENYELCKLFCVIKQKDLCDKDVITGFIKSYRDKQMSNLDILYKKIM